MIKLNTVENVSGTLEDSERTLLDSNTYYTKDLDKKER